MMHDVASTGVAAEELRQFVERLERLDEDKKEVQEELKNVFLELKGRGFDAKAIRQILRIRKMKQNERQEQDALLTLYMQALGMAF
jgi:uncharacterized protein (UPF0335 family)